MAIKKSFVKFLGATGMSVLGAAGSVSAVYVHPAEAQVAQLAQEEAACQAALAANTIEALEDFLAKFPSGSSSCHALALNALSAFQDRPTAIVTINAFGNAPSNRGDGGYGG